MAKQTCAIKERDAFLTPNGIPDISAYAQYRRQNPVVRVCEDLPDVEHIIVPENVDICPGKYSRIRDAVVGISGGNSRMRVCASIVRFVSEQMHEGKIYLEKFFPRYQFVCLWNITQFASLEVGQGDRVDILVEQVRGDVKAAEELALKIYAGITTRDDSPNFERRVSYGPISWK